MKRIGDKESAIKSDDYKLKIIDYLTDHVEGKASDFTELLGLKSSRTRDYLSKLVEEDIIVAEGSNRNRTYRLKS